LSSAAARLAVMQDLLDRLLHGFRAARAYQSQQRAVAADGALPLIRISTDSEINVVVKLERYRLQ
jgi:hypothetical protein